MLNTPVALVIFRRPEFTERVLKTVAAVRPRQLLVVADGPRPGRSDDAENCAAARAVIDRVDWDCEVLKHYSDVNLGCGHGPATGINWVFEQVNEAIILEDDCVPDPTFFRFCEEMLERYRDDERVMHIGGTTYQRASFETPYSYFFSCFNGAWGWATWRRAWAHFDFNLKLWPLLKNTRWLKDLLGDERVIPWWADVFEKAYVREGDVSYWDQQWTFACWANSGLSVRARHNLVSNIGCGEDGTHMFNDADSRANLPTKPMAFPLVHPPLVLQDRDLDRRFIKEVVLPLLPRTEPMWRRVSRRASRYAPQTIKAGLRNILSHLRPTTT